MEHYFACDMDTAIVHTTGGDVQGYVYDDLTIFKGIPYAAAKRFHAPEPVSWSGILNCTSYGCVPPLLDMPEPNGELLVPHRYWVQGEKCLNLNIWTPELDDGKRPVIVWLHGGGFTAGSAIEHDAYDGAEMSRRANAVVISINHRLNILGYLDLSDFGEEYRDSGNNGTNDMVASLRWIRDNIAKFGGDPDNVTLFGQSGGGCKITALLQTPAADGLFHKGFIMSGIVDDDLLKDCTGSGRYMVEALLDELKLTSVKELETVPYDELARAYNKRSPELAAEGKNVGGSPFVNDYYVGDPLTVGFRKETAQIPLLIGTVFGEMSGFRARDYDRTRITEEEGYHVVEKILGKEAADVLVPVFKSTYPDRPVADITEEDFVFRYPSIKYIQERGKLNNSTYAYLFNMDSVLNKSNVPWHCIDVPFWFHNCRLVPTAQKKGVTDRLEEQMFGSFMNFTRTGAPFYPTLPEWKNSTEDTEYTMIFDDDPRVKVNFDHDMEELLEKYAKKTLWMTLLGDMGLIQH